MATKSDYSPLIVIVGETASGKSALAIELAKRFNGELICADSRTIYKGMDIGTAKPSKEDQQAAPHHLLDVVEPNETFNVREFKRLADQAIDNVSRRGKLPILVGGTGLYVDAVLFDYQFSPPGARRDLRNLRHLKYQDLTAYQKGPRPDSLIIGLGLPKDGLESRIEQRTKAMFSSGLEKEVKKLVNKYGWDAPGLNTIGYQEFLPYLAGEQTLDEVRQRVQRASLQFAKRQRTWFKRNKSIQWIENQDQAINLATQFLQNYHSF